MALLGPMRPDRGTQALSGTNRSGMSGYIAPRPNIAGGRSVTPWRPPVRANAQGQYSRPSAPPVERAGPIQQVRQPPSIDQYLGGDTDYQNQLRMFAKALQDFMADATRRRGDVESNYGLSSKALGDQKLKDLDLMEENFGARGMLRSGLYGQEVSDYETEYNKRLEELARQRAQALAGLQQEETQFRSSQQLSEEEARALALRKRAEQYGI